MTINFKKYNSPFLIALCVILFLTIYSFCTYKQRMLFADPSFIVFNIINKKQFIISEYRYGAFITQMFPLIASNLGFSLKSILIIYSLSFYLFYSISSLVLAYVFKQQWLVILLALYLTLFVSDVYFWPNNEVHQGICWMLLFIGLYQSKINVIVKNFLLVTFLTMAISSHLLVVIPLVFLWIYIHSNIRINQLFKSGTFFFYNILMILLISIRYMLSKSSHYDATKLEGVADISFQSIFETFSSGQANSFIQLVLNNYWLILPIIIWGIIILLKSKNYLNLFTYIVLSLGYFILICITFPESFNRNLRFYMESEWMALSIILATPFVLWILKSTKYYLSTLLLICIFSIRIGYIVHSYSYFNERFLTLERHVQNLKNKNIYKALLINDSKNSTDQYIISWGLPIESLLLSKLNNDSIQTTFKIIENTPQDNGNKKTFHSSFKTIPIFNLNRAYFNLDSSQPYTIINSLD